MKYNIEKINEIGKILAEVVEEGIKGEVLIKDVEMALRESLREIGRSALKCFLENAAGEVETEMECACGGKLKYLKKASDDDLVRVW
jgi:hypothetical protein